MRIISKDRHSFWGTHKGHDIQIEREDDGRFYIQVRAPCGALCYDGWAPSEIRSIAAAKREARRGAQLDGPR